MKWWKMRQARKETMDIPQWEEDYKLSPLPDHHMFWEYLEVGKFSQICELNNSIFREDIFLKILLWWAGR